MLMRSYLCTLFEYHIINDVTIQKPMTPPKPSSLSSSLSNTLMAPDPGADTGFRKGGGVRVTVKY